MMLGAAIGALFNGWLSFRLGRKYSLMAGAICSCSARWVCVCFQRGSIDWRPRDTGRSSRDALYRAPLISEMASEKCSRQNDQYVSTDGDVRHCAGFLSDTAFSYSGNWRAMLGVLALPAVLPTLFWWYSAE